MKYCTKCGTQVPDDSKFCTKCGGKLNGESVESPVKSKKPILVGIGVVLVVAVVALVVVLSKGKGSDNPDVAASSSNVSTEKESGGTEKSGDLLDIGDDKKWEKEYAERLDAYLEYYEEHEKDADTVYGWVLLNEDNLPYMVLDYIQSTENSNGDEDHTYNITVLDYMDDTVGVLAERQFEYMFTSPIVLSNVCFIDSGSSFFELKDGRLIELTEKDFGSEGEVNLSPYVRIEWDSENNRIGEVYEDSFYYDISTSPYTYIGRVCRMPGPRLCSMGEISSKVLEDILLGKREATAFDFYKIDDEVFFNEGDRFYIGSDECYWPDFCRELLSHYDAEEKRDAIIKSEGIIYGEGFFEGSSFRTLLRELKKRPVSSIEELVGFYVEFLILENGIEEYSSSVISKDSCAAGSDEVYQQPSQSEIEDYLEKERKRATDYLEKLSKEVGSE